MAIDRGSLDYRIRVTDQFSKPIAKFRQDLLKARNTARFVKQEIQGATTAIGNLGVASKRAGTQTKKLTKEELARWKAVREGARTAATAERLRARARKDNIQESARLAKKAAAEAKAEARTAKTAAAARVRASKAAANAAERAVRQQKRLNRELSVTQRRGNRLTLTFKRLAGVFIGFQAIRFGAEAIRESITAGIRFNSVIESSRIGMAGLFATLQSISNVQSGKLLTGAEAFAGALVIADETLEKLRNRSLATAATFAELSTAFRAGFAPGVSAGLDIDETIFVTERFSQILTGLGIAQNQINEEIRSFLTATAQSRTSIIPTLFFGGAAESNRFVKQAKLVGDLFPKIVKRLEAFQQAAGETQKTLIGMAARLKGVFEITTGRASLLLFEELKGFLNDVQDLLVTTTKSATGFIESVTPREDTVILLSRTFATLKNITKQVRVFVASFGQSEIAFFLATLGAAVEILAALILGAFSGVIRAVALVGSLIQFIGFALGGLDLDALRDLVSLLTTGAVLVTTVTVGIAAWTIVLKFASKALKAVNIAFFLAATASQGILKGIALIPGGVFRAAGVVALLGIAFLEVVKAVSGIDLGLKDLPNVLGEVIKNIATKTLALASLIAAQIKSQVILAFLEVANAVANFFENINEALSIFRKDAGAQDLNQANERAKIARLQVIHDTEVKHALAINLLKDIAAQTDKDADKLQADRLLKLEKEVGKRLAAAAAAERLAEAADKANESTKGFLETLIGGINSIVDGLIDGDIIDVDDIVARLKAALEKGFEAQPKLDTEEAEGFAEKVTKAFSQMGDTYANTLAIMKALTSQFSNFLSTEIAEALDPNNDPDGPSANERFKAFLDQIGKLIIQKLVELAIAKSILFIAGAESGGQITGAARGGQIGFDDGGTVPGGRHQAAQFRPASVAQSDTVPAWLTPGEFVNPVKSVMKYGADLFEGLRTGALDPAALREAAGLTNRRRSVKKVRARGFAEGGPIGALAAEGRASIQQQENTAARQSAPMATPALMVSDDQMMDRLMAGGQRQFRNWAENDKEFFRGIVRE